MTETYCKKCGIVSKHNKSKYCGDGSDKNNEHRWEKREAWDADDTMECANKKIEDELLSKHADLINRGMAKQPGDPRFLKMLEDIGNLHKKKSADYGTDVDPFANIRVSEEDGLAAWRNAWGKARDKISRISTFCRKGHLENENVDDSFMDLASYAIISLVLLRESRGEKQ